MRKKMLCVSFILACVTFGVFSQEKRDKKELTLEQQVKINAHIEQLLEGGMLYEAAERRAMAVFESGRRVSTRSRLAMPPTNGIWVNRDPDNLANPHPVYNTATAEDLVKNVLLSDPSAQSRISNVIYTGEPLTSPDRALAYFENGDAIDIPRGLILSTYQAMMAEAPNVGTAQLGGGTMLTGDLHLTSIATSTVNGGAILQFDFQPYMSEATFDFIFVSEEYPDYSNATVNDAFGFFVFEQGDPTNYVNIALFPDGTDVTINSSNWGQTWGSNTLSGLPAPLGDAVNPQWHVPIYDDDYVGSDSIMEYDGRTVKLQAVARNLDPNKTYTLKLAICNVQDNNYGSAVFLSNLDLGSATIGFTSPYLSGARANSSFHGISAGYSSISGGVKDYVEDLIGNDPAFGLGAIDNYKGFLYSGCKYVINEDQLTFVGVGEDVVFGMCGDDEFKKYIKVDSLFIGGEKVEYCYEGGTGREKSILDYVWGQDTIRRGIADDGVLYFYLESLPEELAGKPFGISNFVYQGGISGGGDTAVFLGFDRINTDVKYIPVMGNIHSGSLKLGLEGGSKYIRWANVDGSDCDAEYNERCYWRFLRDTITGEELSFSNWELLKLYNGDDRVSIIIQEPGSCYVDTVWIGGSSFAEIQRYISIPHVPGVETDPKEGKHYVSGHKDFSFTAKFVGDPMDVLATGYYSKTVLNLNETAEKLVDGSYKYVIRKVVEPWTVTFAPKLNSGDVSNETLESQSVWSSGNTLYINVKEPCTVTIYTITGLLYKQVTVGDNTAISLPKGFYVVSVNGLQYKVVIK